MNPPFLMASFSFFFFYIVKDKEGERERERTALMTTVLLQNDAGFKPRSSSRVVCMIDQMSLPPFNLFHLKIFLGAGRVHTQWVHNLPCWGPESKSPGTTWEHHVWRQGTFHKQWSAAVVSSFHPLCLYLKSNKEKKNFTRCSGTV